jgi:hypothetical protein
VRTCVTALLAKIRLLYSMSETFPVVVEVALAVPPQYSS